ncbi:tryptophan synthase subunit alpha [Actinomyces lilanjuaniae]|uniref:Tryptophan synthase alpha chain n=1 Tax=Actinomyces lilanjuaniae TaxID=2321394 RepID=A0ABN5PPN8_9ACTO|nr:tryptophan synthase subunit alpha [Actinomyces lilanjuaniae]AYD89979.1 tryptophan synthase subunit alpha [Actinomyces lilanjuaniae]
MSRYTDMFRALKAREEGAFVPFVMVGDPDLDVCEAVIEALVAGGADALELGVPFSDPVADGPTIQRAHVRALESGAGFHDCLKVVARVRARHHQVPIGMLVYGNVPFALGLERFYADCAGAGIDSVLLPDVPVRESLPFSAAARAAGVDPVYIAPPSAADHTLDAVAAASRGYIYAVSRVGVTGTEHASSTVGLAQAVERLRSASAAPVMLGFGISRPDQVTEALAAGADGAISGSATVRIVESHAASLREAPRGSTAYEAELEALSSELVEFCSAMKAATHRSRQSALQQQRQG